MMSKMPMPRRKRWWEKLAEKQHDHFYKHALNLLPTVPDRFKPVYNMIIKERLIHLVLRIQRAVKKRSLERWLVEQSPGNQNWQNNILVKVNMHHLD